MDDVLGDRDQGGCRIVEDACSRFDGRGPGVDDDPQGLGGALDAADGEVRIVGTGRAGADDDRVRLGAQPVDVGSGLGRGDPAAGAVGGGDAAVQRGRVLPGDIGATEADSGEPGGIARCGLRAEESGAHLDAGCAQRVRTSGGLRVRVSHRVDHAGDSRLDERLGAGSGTTGVVTGFEGDVCGAAAGSSVCRRQGIDLGVRATGPLVEAFAHGRHPRHRE